MWTTTKSSNRDLAPGKLVGFSLDGFSMRHSMAAMYSFFSAAEMSPLILLVCAVHHRKPSHTIPGGP
jgi:hypothetical protein